MEICHFAGDGTVLYPSKSLKDTKKLGPEKRCRMAKNKHNISKCK